MHNFFYTFPALTSAIVMLRLLNDKAIFPGLQNGIISLFVKREKPAGVVWSQHFIPV